MMFILRPVRPTQDAMLFLPLSLPLRRLAAAASLLAAVLPAAQAQTPTPYVPVVRQYGDFLVTHDGVRPFISPRVRTKNTHGTGCTLSSAVTAFLALGHSLPEAVGRAKDYLTGALEYGRGFAMGTGHGSVNHFYAPKTLQELHTKRPSTPAV